jgi:hypothetical protein
MSPEIEESLRFSWTTCGTLGFAQQTEQARPVRCERPSVISRTFAKWHSMFWEFSDGLRQTPLD